MVAVKNGDSTGKTTASSANIAERINKNHYREAIVLEERKSPPKPKVPSTLESQALYNRAMENISRSKYAKAIELLKEALHIAPENPYYLSALGLCLAQQGEDFDAAIKLCRKALILCPGETMLQVNLGKVYKLKGDMKGAYSIFLDAWRRNKEHPSPAAELSRMGIRRPPVIPFLDRSNRLNKYLGMLRSKLERAFKRKPSF